jgi:hypothetical protein
MGIWVTSIRIKINKIKKKIPDLSLGLGEGPTPTGSSYWLTHLSTYQQYTKRQRRIKHPRWVAPTPFRWLGGSRGDHSLVVNSLTLFKLCLDGVEEISQQNRMMDADFFIFLVLKYLLNLFFKK